MVYSGQPDFIHLARDPQDTAEVLTYCNNHKMPVTFCGSQTSMTGASVADTGLALALAHRNKIIDISMDPQNQEAFVTTEPGVILGDLKRAVAAAGYLYPPDPTSFNEAQIGATVATNATGEESFRFGATRLYVNELEILTAQGKIRTLKRMHDCPATPVKNSGGYKLGSEEIDQLIGSEGTLALITKLKLRLVRDVTPGRFVLVLPFNSFDHCLDAVVRLAKSTPQPRALELIGPGAGHFFRDCAACPTELRTFKIFLYIRDDYTDDKNLEEKLTVWFNHLNTMYKAVNEPKQVEHVFVAKTDLQLETIRQCRHHIPLKVNETYFPYTTQGGGKVGTDWWVPVEKLPKIMLTTQKEAEELQLDYLVFGHIGNGHPHWNFLTRHPDEFAKARAFVQRQCRRAVKAGGGVAGEHGIGKIKRDLLAIQYPADIIQKMISLKTKWDPNWILGRGNILAPPDQ